VVNNTLNLQKIFKLLKKTAAKPIFLFVGIAAIPMLIVVAIIAPKFFTIRNVINIADAGSINLVFAIGMTFVIIGGGIDLSIGSVMALVGVFGVGIIKFGGMPAFIGIFLTIFIGGLIGFVNGISIVKFKIAPLVVTLAMGVAARSIVYVYTGGSNIFPVPHFYDLLSNKIFGIPVNIIIALILALLANYILSKTKYGIYLYAVGGNPLAARFSGIKNSLILITTYTINGLCAGVAGLLMVSRLSCAMPSVGQGVELIIIASVVVGGTSLSGGKGNIIGTILGVFLISVISNIINMLSVPPSYNGLITGIIIFTAVLIDSYRKK